VETVVEKEKGAADAAMEAAEAKETGGAKAAKTKATNAKKMKSIEKAEAKAAKERIVEAEKAAAEAEARVAEAAKAAAEAQARVTEAKVAEAKITETKRAATEKMFMKKAHKTLKYFMCIWNEKDKSTNEDEKLQSSRKQAWKLFSYAINTVRYQRALKSKKKAEYTEERARKDAEAETTNLKDAEAETRKKAIRRIPHNILVKMERAMKSYNLAEKRARARAEVKAKERAVTYASRVATNTTEEGERVAPSDMDKEVTDAGGVVAVEVATAARGEVTAAALAVSAVKEVAAAVLTTTARKEPIIMAEVAEASGAAAEVAATAAEVAAAVELTTTARAATKPIEEMITIRAATKPTEGRKKRMAPSDMVKEVTTTAVATEFMYTSEESAILNQHFKVGNILKRDDPLVILNSDIRHLRVGELVAVKEPFNKSFHFQVYSVLNEGMVLGNTGFILATMLATHLFIRPTVRMHFTSSTPTTPPLN
jgi:hypothetical protein